MVDNDLDREATERSANGPRPLLIWGATGQAKVLLEFLSPSEFQLAAVFDNDPAAVAPQQGISVFCGESGFRQWQSGYSGASPAALIAIGSPGQARLQIQRFLEQHDVESIQAVHPTAVVARTARLGKGCQILAQAVIAAGAVLGDQCIVNTSASVDHESVLGDGVHVAPGARLLGCVEIGAFSFIGAGAVVLSRVKVGSNSIVGAGAVVLDNVPDNTVVYGNPAQVKRTIMEAARP